MRAIGEAGRRIPDDIAVIGIDDIEEGRFSTPTLTTVAPDKEYIGRLAVQALIARIEGKPVSPPYDVQPPFRLITRESTLGGLRPYVNVHFRPSHPKRTRTSPGQMPPGRLQLLPGALRRHRPADQDHHLIRLHQRRPLRRRAHHRDPAFAQRPPQFQSRASTPRRSRRTSSSSATGTRPRCALR